MKFIAHRGYWKEAREKNTLAAFERAFSLGFGAEIDVRDSGSTLVVAHNPPKESETVLFEQVLEVYRENALRGGGQASWLAINVKSCGLASDLIPLLEKTAPDRHFFFDMAVPDALDYLKRGGKAFTRQSEYEKSPPYYDTADGVWMDEFRDNWISSDEIQRHRAHDKKVCLVSPELHGRDHRGRWPHYRELDANVMFCTDFPEEAEAFFKGIK